METVNCEFSVEGMHCAACELVIEKKLKKHKAVKSVDAKLGEGKVIITLEKDVNTGLLREEFNALIAEDGYRLVDKNQVQRANLNELGIAFGIALFLLLAFLFVQSLGLSDYLNPTAITLPFMFILGLVASISSCMAVVGGLVLTLSSQFAKEKRTVPLLGFHLSRIVTFFVLGGALGYVGTSIDATRIPPLAVFILNLMLFVFMMVIGLNMLEAFPSLKKFQPKIPKSLSSKITNSSYTSIVGSIFLGALTFILPCGFTQAAQGLALKSGSFTNGMLYMGTFVLGTFPALGLISFTSVKLSKSLQSGLFFKVAGFIILLFALFNFLGALIAIGVLPPLFNF